MVAGGAYQQYVITNAVQCIALPEKVNFDAGSMSFVNPLSALALVDRAVGHGAKAIVLTAAFSQLGKLVNGICHQRKIPLICIVRRDEQARLLKADYDAQYVFNSTDPSFTQAFTDLAAKLSATCCLECCGGNFTADVLSMMPRKSTILFYGSLNPSGLANINPMSLIGKDSVINGWVLGHHMNDLNLKGKLNLLGRAKAIVADPANHSTIQKRVGFSQIREGIQAYYKGMSDGKVLLCPQELDEALEGASEDSDILKEFTIAELLAPAK